MKEAANARLKESQVGRRSTSVNVGDNQMLTGIADKLRSTVMKNLLMGKDITTSALPLPIPKEGLQRRSSFSDITDAKTPK